jgi:hypothetical protein
MPFTMRTRYLLVTLAIAIASAIELYRGYRPIIVLTGAAGFLIAGFITVYRSDSKARALRRQQKLDYWTN